MPRKTLPVGRLGRRDDAGDAGARRERTKESQNELSRQVARKRARRVVVVQRQREVVQRGENRQDETDQPESSDESPFHVLARDPRDEDAEHRERLHGLLEEERVAGGLAVELVGVDPDPIAVDASAAGRWGRFLAVLITSGGFAMVHSEQLGQAWGPLLVLFMVGLVLTLTRVVTRSITPGLLVHVGYNLTLFTLLYLGTDHFRHLERMTQ